MINKLTHKLKEPERDCEGAGFQVEGSDGSDVVISSQLIEEIRSQTSISRFTKKKFQELVDNSQFNPKYTENRMTLKNAKQLARYNEANIHKAPGV